jgi:nicotinamidase-related amidase
MRPEMKTRKALIVVDMLNDFLDKKGALYCGDKARRIIPFIKKRINQVRKEKGVIIFLADTHKRGDLEFKLFPRHCLEKTWGAEVVKELILSPQDYLIPKTRYSGFYKTDLEKVLRKERIGKVEITGVCTSICVMDTVGDLRNRDYKIKVFKKGVADFDSQAQRFALERMKNIYGAEVA